LHKPLALKKFIYSCVFIVTMSFQGLLAMQNAANNSIGDTILPPVFLIGEYENQYNELVGDYETLLFTACDFDMNSAFSKWQSMLKEMDSFAKQNNINLDGVKLWLNVFMEPDGQISHLAYYLKPMSKNADDAELNALFKEFIKDYRFPLLSKSTYSHYGTASFPVFPVRNENTPSTSGQLSTGQN